MTTTPTRQEDPVTTLEGLGWNPLDADNGETSYFFGGLAGSLDHVFANDAALDLVTGRDDLADQRQRADLLRVQPLQLQRRRRSTTQTAFRSSDHNPEIIGIKAPTSTAPATVDTVQVLASNDFHGRLLDDPAQRLGRCRGDGRRGQGPARRRTATPSFAMAGDIVGASTFESFIQNDKPTIDAMNEAGLEVSAAGNHEFDQGYDDLMDRIMSRDRPRGWGRLALHRGQRPLDAATGDLRPRDRPHRRQLRPLQRRHLVEGVRRPQRRRTASASASSAR